MYNRNLHFHFTGIGGSGMSGLAELLLAHGFRVSGSDLRASEITQCLTTSGAAVSIGHAADHVPQDASLLVYSSAVSDTNPELIEARRRGIPIVRRAEVLAELMRLKFGVAVAGSHGKTTTTSMIAAVLEGGGLDPTVVIGGQVRSSRRGSRFGRSEYLVAESDESDRSFLLLKPTIAVVTNIDSEHLNAYGSMQELTESFQQFLDAVPFYGLAVLGVDDPRVRGIGQRYRGRRIGYGVALDAAVRPHNIILRRQYSEFDVLVHGEKVASVRLHLVGRHLVVNSLAAFAVGLEFGIPAQSIADSLSAFSGVCRRLETVGDVGGVTVVSDYGHHPSEIRATLRAVREAWGEELGSLHVVFQPHRYSRTRDCFPEFLDAFHEADHLILTDIYAAGEAQCEGVSGALLFEAITHPHKIFVENVDEVPELLRSEVKPRDVVLCLGAGSVGALPERLLRTFVAHGGNEREIAVLREATATFASLRSP